MREGDADADADADADPDADAGAVLCKKVKPGRTFQLTLPSHSNSPRSRDRLSSAPTRPI
jgi:hypothetical protein